MKEISKEYARFKDPFDLVEWIHKNCKEWEDVGKTSKPLPYERVLEAVGKKDVIDLTNRIREFQHLHEAHSNVR